MPPEHLQDQVFGRDPFREPAGQLDPPDLRTGEVKGVPGHGQGDIKSAGTDGKHAHPGGRGGVGVGAEHDFPRHAETLKMHLVGDTVARFGEMDAEPLCSGHQEDMIVGVLVVGLEQVVVDVLGSQLDFDPVDPHGHEFQHRHGAGCILEKGMIDPDGDFAAGGQFPGDKVGFENLCCEVFWHIRSPFVRQTALAIHGASGCICRLKIHPVAACLFSFVHKTVGAIDDCFQGITRSNLGCSQSDSDTERFFFVHEE